MVLSKFIDLFRWRRRSQSALEAPLDAAENRAVTFALAVVDTAAEHDAVIHAELRTELPALFVLRAPDRRGALALLLIGADTGDRAGAPHALETPLQDAGVIDPDLRRTIAGGVLIRHAVVGRVVRVIQIAGQRETLVGIAINGLAVAGGQRLPGILHERRAVAIFAVVDLDPGVREARAAALVPAITDADRGRRTADLFIGANRAQRHLVAVALHIGEDRHVIVEAI